MHDILFYFQDRALENDAMYVTFTPDCKIRANEEKKLVYLRTQQSEAVRLFHEGKENLTKASDIIAIEQNFFLLSLTFRN